MLWSHLSIREISLAALALQQIAGQVPEYCFTTAFSSFCFASLYIRHQCAKSCKGKALQLLEGFL